MKRKLLLLMNFIIFSCENKSVDNSLEVLTIEKDNNENIIPLSTNSTNTPLNPSIFSSNKIKNLQLRINYLNISNKNILIFFFINFIWFVLFAIFLGEKIDEKINNGKLINDNITFIKHPLLYLFPLIPMILMLIIKLFDYKTIKSLNNKMYFLSYYGLEILYLLIFSILLHFKFITLIDLYHSVDDNNNIINDDNNNKIKINEMNKEHILGYFFLGSIMDITITNIINKILLINKDKELSFVGIKDIMVNKNNNYLFKSNNSLFFMDILSLLLFGLSFIHLILGGCMCYTQLFENIDISNSLQIKIVYVQKTISTIIIIYLSIRTFNDLKFFKSLNINNFIYLKKYWFPLFIANAFFIFFNIFIIFNFKERKFNFFNIFIIFNFKKIDFHDFLIFYLNNGLLLTIINNFIINSLYYENIKNLDIDIQKDNIN